MRSELKLDLLITAFAILLGVFSYFVKNLEPGDNIISPVSKTASIFSFFGRNEKPKKIIYGYLPWWSLEKIEYLQLDKLTDIAYFGLHINSDGSFQEYLDDGTPEPGYQRWQENKDLKKLIKQTKKHGVRFSLTIISHYDDTSDEFLGCQSCWITLAQNIKSEMKRNGAEHVNLNFEYAGETDIEQARQYSEFAKFLNGWLDAEYGDSYLVTSAFADSVYKPRVSSDLNNLGKAVDGIFIMAYDFHRPTSDYAGPVAPINQPGFDIKEMLGDYLANVPPEKIILGVPYYGYNWVVEDATPRSKRIEGAEEIGFSQSQTYAGVMETILEVNPYVNWDEEARVPYFTYVSPETGSIRQAYYENERSLTEKYDLVLENDLAGVGIWALGYDDGYKELWGALYDSFVR